MSCIAAGKLNLDPAEMDLVEAVRESLTPFRELLEEKKIPVEVRAGSPVRVRCDRFRTEQVVANLMMNAIKFGGGKPIVVEIGGDAREAWFEVGDHGVGMSPEFQSRLFEPFEQAARKDYHGGLGLGLYISRQIAEAHGGRIAVDSEVGTGTKLRVTLPRSGPPPAGGAKAPSGGVPS